MPEAHDQNNTVGFDADTIPGSPLCLRPKGSHVSHWNWIGIMVGLSSPFTMSDQ